MAKTAAKKKTTTKKKTATKSTVAKRVTAKKAAPKKSTAKKAASKKTTAKKAATKKPARKALKVTEPMKKSELFNHIAESTELSRKEIGSVFDILSDVMHKHLKKGGPGEFTVPGLMKCKVTRKPATKARKGINPFTGEETTFKAKPARNVIKVRPLKKLKEMAN